MSNIMTRTLSFVLICSVIHVSLCVLSFIRMRSGRTQIGFILIPMAVLIPIFGAASVFILERTVSNKRDGLAVIDNSSYNAGVYKSIPVEQEDPELTIPLEEAILISDETTRRAVMMNILHRNPGDFIELLKKARFAEDVEVTHYATSTIMEIQREFDILLEEAGSEFRKAPEDIDIVDRYVSALVEYIKSGLLDGHLLLQQREELLQALSAKLALRPDSKSTQLRIVDNYIRLGQYEYAWKLVSAMTEAWPHDEEVWLTALSVVIQKKNAAEKAELMERIKAAPVHWSTSGQNTLAFICGDDFISALIQHTPNKKHVIKVSSHPR